MQVDFPIYNILYLSVKTDSKISNTVCMWNHGLLSKHLIYDMQEEEKAKVGVRDLFTLPISNLDTSIFTTIKKRCRKYH